MPPRTLGPYEVHSIVGRGGIGTVYRARHRDSGEEVAVKLLAPPPACDPAAARRLAREFEALRDLRHPNVVRVYEVGVQEGYSFLAMELVEGLDLRSYLSPLLDAYPTPAAAPSARSLASRHPRRDGSDRGAGTRAGCADSEVGGSTPDTPAPSSTLTPWSHEPETESLLIAPAARASSGTDAVRAFAALMDEPETYPGPETSSKGAPDAARPRGRPGVARPLPPDIVERLNGRERIARLREAIVQVCDGLAYVHGRGLVHRDLKPSNIMVDDARRVRLMDFGLVKLAGDSSSLTQHGRVVGTYRYMAPEQARGEPVDHRADLYSLGVILFELLCGSPPFTALLAPELWDAIVSAPPPAVLTMNPAAPPGLARVADRLLAKDARERYRNAEEVAAEIRRPS